MEAPPAPAPDLTGLLAAARAGERGALDRLFPLVYDELHRIARRQRRAAGASLTLSTTALVHEAYLRLVDQTRLGAEDRAHFYAVAATAMRHLLVDYARRRRRLKRGGGAPHVGLTHGDALRVDSSAEDVLALDDALRRLEALDPRLARVVELRFFGGLDLDEVAALMGCSDRTVKRDWRKARAFLLHQLNGAA